MFKIYGQELKCPIFQQSSTRNDLAGPPLKFKKEKFEKVVEQARSAWYCLNQNLWDFSKDFEYFTIENSATEFLYKNLTHPSYITV